MARTVTGICAILAALIAVYELFWWIGGSSLGLVLAILAGTVSALAFSVLYLEK